MSHKSWKLSEDIVLFVCRFLRRFFTVDKFVNSLIYASWLVVERIVSKTIVLVRVGKIISFPFLGSTVSRRLNKMLYSRHRIVNRCTEQLEKRRLLVLKMVEAFDKAIMTSRLSTWFLKSRRFWHRPSFWHCDLLFWAARRRSLWIGCSAFCLRSTQWVRQVRRKLLRW